MFFALLVDQLPLFFLRLLDESTIETSQPAIDAQNLSNFLTRGFNLVRGVGYRRLDRFLLCIANQNV